MEANEHRILIVDDEENVLKALKRAFAEDGYTVDTYTSPKDALAFLAGQRVSAIISDFMMPEMNGLEFLLQAAEVIPDSVRIILTGHANLEMAIKAINSGAVYGYLTKPWDNDHIRVFLKNALKKYELEKENKRLNNLLKERNEQLKDMNQNLEKKVKEQTRFITNQFNQLKVTFMETVKAFSRTVELRNPEIGAHMGRVASISKAIAENMGIKGEDLQDIVVAAWLHDIGKIGLPDVIIEKQEKRLTDEESGLLREHSTLGEVCLKAIPGFKNVSTIVRHHHERYDGGGWPDSLYERHIPLGSRIIYAADVFDKRVYSLGYGHPEQVGKAWEYIKAHSGKFFDPDVVAALSVIQKSWEKSVKRLDIPKKVVLDKLKSGVVLAEDLKTKSGLLLLPKGVKLNELHIIRIINFHNANAIKGWVLVLEQVKQ
ncbi:MAG: response regulator [Deltaproteobacteria bacterium]|nr:response regulator [Deltaproteobacteria bacterium]